MESFVFPSSTQSHQRAPSIASFCSGIVHDSSSSRPSSTTLQRPEYVGGHPCHITSSSSISSSPTAHCRVLRGKPSSSSRATSCCSRQTWRMPSCSQSSFSNRRDSSKRKLPSRDVKCGTLENESKACSLVQYMTNSHRALYHKSSFPRRLDSDGFCNLRGTKRFQKKESKKPLSPVNNELNSSRSPSSVPLQLDGQVANLREMDRINTIPPDKTVHERVSVALDHTHNNEEKDKLVSLGNFQQMGPGETTASKPREATNLPSLIFVKRKQQDRVMKIREFVNAAEVIQRTWRTHKRKKKEERS